MSKTRVISRSKQPTASVLHKQTTQTQITSTSSSFNLSSTSPSAKAEKKRKDISVECKGQRIGPVCYQRRACLIQAHKTAGRSDLDNFSFQEVKNTSPLSLSGYSYKLTTNKLRSCVIRNSRYTSNLKPGRAAFVCDNFTVGEDACHHYLEGDQLVLCTSLPHRNSEDCDLNKSSYGSSFGVHHTPKTDGARPLEYVNVSTELRSQASKKAERLYSAHYFSSTSNQFQKNKQQNIITRFDTCDGESCVRNNTNSVVETLSKDSQKDSPGCSDCEDITRDQTLDETNEPMKDHYHVLKYKFRSLARFSCETASSKEAGKSKGTQESGLNTLCEKRHDQSSSYHAFLQEIDESASKEVVMAAECTKATTKIIDKNTHCLDSSFKVPSKCKKRRRSRRAHVYSDSKISTSIAESSVSIDNRHYTETDDTDVNLDYCIESSFILDKNINSRSSSIEKQRLCSSPSGIYKTNVEHEVPFDFKHISKEDSYQEFGSSYSWHRVHPLGDDVEDSDGSSECCWTEFDDYLIHNSEKTVELCIVCQRAESTSTGSICEDDQSCSTTTLSNENFSDESGRCLITTHSIANI